jgi:hypothetical protein
MDWSVDEGFIEMLQHYGLSDGDEFASVSEWRQRHLIRHIKRLRA